MKKVIMTLLLMAVFCTTAAADLINFEDGMVVGTIAKGKVENSKKYSFDGCNSLKVTQNEPTSPLKISVNNPVITGGTYTFAVSIKQDPVKFRQKSLDFKIGVMFAGVPVHTVSQKTVAYGEFVVVRGEYTHQKENGNVEIFVNCNSQNVGDYYVDSVRFEPKVNAHNLFENGDFENTSKPLPTNAHSYNNTYKKSGENSIKVMSKTTYGGLDDIQLPQLKSGFEYYYSLWVRLDPTFTVGNKQLELSVEYAFGKGVGRIEENLDTLILGGNSDFVHLYGKFKVPKGEQTQVAKLKLLSVNKNVIFYVDDVEIIENAVPKIMSTTTRLNNGADPIVVEFSVPIINNNIEVTGTTVSKIEYFNDNKGLIISHTPMQNGQFCNVELKGVQSLCGVTMEDVKYAVFSPTNAFATEELYVDYQKPTQQKLELNQVVSGEISYVVKGFTADAPQKIQVSMAVVCDGKLLNMATKTVDTAKEKDAVVTLNILDEHLALHPQLKLLLWECDTLKPIN